MICCKLYCFNHSYPSLFMYMWYPFVHVSSALILSSPVLWGFGWWPDRTTYCLFFSPQHPTTGIWFIFSLIISSASICLKPSRPLSLWAQSILGRIMNQCTGNRINHYVAILSTHIIHWKWMYMSSADHTFTFLFPWNHHTVCWGNHNELIYCPIMVYSCLIHSCFVVLTKSVCLSWNHSGFLALLDDFSTISFCGHYAV